MDPDQQQVDLDTDDQHDDDEDAPRDGLAVLADIDRGALVEDLTAEIAEVVRAVRATGKKGGVKLTLSIKPDKHLDHALDVIASVSGSVPKPDRAALFFDSPAGALRRDDPRQTRMF